MRHRYFIVTEGPLIERLKETIALRRKAESALRKFLKETGASQVYGSGPASYRFDFPSGKDADPNVWRKTRPVRGTYFFLPRKNTPGGKELAAKVKALPACPSLNSALSVVPELPVGFPCVIEGNTGYIPHIRFYSMRDPVMIVVQIPWRDVDPKALAAYKRQAASPRRREWSATMEYAQWLPPEWMREIKEWEALKIIDETGG